MINEGLVRLALFQCMIQVSTGRIKICISNENLLLVLTCLGVGFSSSFPVGTAAGSALEAGLVSAPMAPHLQLEPR